MSCKAPSRQIGSQSRGTFYESYGRRMPTYYHYL
jgi:hypothetical protein